MSINATVLAFSCNITYNFRKISNKKMSCHAVKNKALAKYKRNFKRHVARTWILKSLNPIQKKSCLISYVYFIHSLFSLFFFSFFLFMLKVKAIFLRKIFLKVFLCLVLSLFLCCFLMSLFLKPNLSWISKIIKKKDEVREKRFTELFSNYCN